MSKYKFNGHIIKPSGGKGKCENCGEMVRLKKSYIDKDGNTVERCGNCDEFESKNGCELI